MNTNTNKNFILALFLLAMVGACVPTITKKSVNKNLPDQFSSSEDTTKLNSNDTTNSAVIDWKKYFTDPNLVSLIDTALKNNQELNIILYEINIAKNEVKARKSKIFPTVDLEAGAGIEKAGEYTRNGAVDQALDIRPGEKIPENLPNYGLGAVMTWEIDIWKKLRNAKKSAVLKYLASVDGRNFMITNLVSEIATSYYELMALDNQLEIIKKNIEIQTSALKAVRIEKQSAKVTELAVKRFEAQVYHSQSLQFNIQQQIIEKENRINFLLGRYPQPIERNSENFLNIVPDTVYAGVPSQLLENRLDIKKAEKDLEAARLDVKVAKANFYPTFRIKAGVGFEAFNPKLVFNSPSSLIFSAAGTLVAPLINRAEIKAMYLNANAKQIQAAYMYERTVLNAYIEVANQLAKINNIRQSYDYKYLQVQKLNESVTISIGLFMSARADYMEVLLTQRDAVEAKLDLVETKRDQINAMLYFYRSLGGGWK